MANFRSKRILIAGFVAAAACFFSFSAALAQYGLAETAKSAGIPTNKSIPVILGDAIGTGLSMISVVFFALMLYAGIRWMIARGNDEDAKKAQDTIIAAVIGIVIVIAAYALTNFVFTSVGISTAGGAAAPKAPGGGAAPAVPVVPGGGGAPGGSPDPVPEPEIPPGPGQPPGPGAPQPPGGSSGACVPKNNDASCQSQFEQQWAGYKGAGGTATDDNAKKVACVGDDTNGCTWDIAAQKCVLSGAAEQCTALNEEPDTEEAKASCGASFYCKWQ